MRTSLLLFALLVSYVSLAQTRYLFAGTYTKAGSKGIYVYRFDTASGKADWVSNTDSIPNPSFLAIAPGNKFIYAVNEEGDGSGSVSSFSFDSTSGKLTFINKQPSGGDHPCYLATDKHAKWLLAGNYTGGSIAAFPINADGSIAPFSQLIRHKGKSINAQRQEKAHVHATVFSPIGDLLFTPDLGLDKVMIYQFNAAAEKPLRPARPSSAAAQAGSGPRHFVFHPNEKFAYLIEELTGTVSAFSFDGEKLTPTQRMITHPEGYTGDIGSADIHVSPDGKFLYASNRGDENTITIFSIDSSSGKLTLKGYQPTLGKTPRNFVIEPSGKYLLVANQETNNIVIFRRDPATGLLQETGEQIQVPNPVCLKFMN